MSDDKPAKPYPKVSQAPPPAPTLDKVLADIPRSLNTYPSPVVRKQASKANMTATYRPIKADPSHWTLEVDWDVQDGAILVVDLDPREGLGGQFKTLLRDDMSDSMTRSLTSEQLAMFRHVETVIRRATAHNSTLPKKYDTVYEDITGDRAVWITTPADFAAWVVKFSPVPVPEWMKALAGESERDRLARELAEARAANERAVAEIVALQMQLKVQSIALPAETPARSNGETSSHWTADGGIVTPEIQRDEKGVSEVIDRADKKPDPPPSEAMITKMLGVYEDLDRPSMTKVAELTGFDRDSKSFKAAWKVVIERAKKAGP